MREPIELTTNTRDAIHESGKSAHDHESRTQPVSSCSRVPEAPPRSRSSPASRAPHIRTRGQCTENHGATLRSLWPASGVTVKRAGGPRCTANCTYSLLRSGHGTATHHPHASVSLITCRSCERGTHRHPPHNMCARSTSQSAVRAAVC
eukprot:589270-Prymnesium_polylepis.1